MFAGDGSDVGGILPVGGAAVVALAVALVLAALGRLPAPRVGRSGVVLVCGLAGLTLWIGITMSWSIAGDRSWDAFNKAMAYARSSGSESSSPPWGGRSVRGSLRGCSHSCSA